MARTKKPTGKEPVIEAPSARSTLIAKGPLRPPAAVAEPVAPMPAATLIGPLTTKPPAKPTRAKPPPPPPPRPKVPKPAAKRAQTQPPVDPVKTKAARQKQLRALGKQARWRFDGDVVVELRLNGYDAGCTPTNVSAILSAEPITELAIEGCDPDQLARLLALPGIERVKRLAISGWDASDGGTYVGRVLAKASRIGGVVELRAGIKLGDAGVASLAGAEGLAACVHLALGSADASPEAFAALAASPLGQRLETFEWLRENLTADIAKLITMMPSLRTLVASTGYVDAFRDMLSARFRKHFIVESEPGMGYLIDGVRGVSHRPVPKR